MTLPGEAEGFAASAQDGSPWRDEISPGVFLTIALHRPHRKAASIPTPLWVGLGDRDITVSAPAVRKLAERAPRGELHRYDVDHFEPFHADTWRTIAADQVAFLERVVPAPACGVRPA